MNRNGMKQVLSLLLCIVLVAAMALFAVGCNDNTTPTNSENPAPSTDAQSQPEATSVGEGQKVFTFEVVDTEGKKTTFEVHTDEKIVGTALTKLNLIAGEQGDYGLYVKTVNGITLDWDQHGKFWAFYVNGESSLTGVDSVEVTPGATYSFKAE